MTIPALHSEAAFESAIEDALLARGWVKGAAAGYDRECAVAPADLFAFIWATQPDLWQQLGMLYGAL